MIKHSKLTKCQMLDWIKDRLERGDAMPTDEEIVDRFILSGVESARTLLADLADEGAITIHWNAPGRPIELGPRERRRMASTAPIPTVVKHDPAVDAGVDRILAIVNRGGEKRQPESTECKPSASQVAPQPPRSKSHLPSRLRPAATSKLPRQKRIAGSKQINSKVDPAIYAAVNALASESCVSISAMCGRLVAEALTARRTQKQPAPKPRIPANVMAAYLADGRDFAVFFDLLLEFGLAEYLARRRRVPAAT